jgi:hypothetical protein
MLISALHIHPKDSGHIVHCDALEIKKILSKQSKTDCMISLIGKLKRTKSSRVTTSHQRPEILKYLLIINQICYKSNRSFFCFRTKKIDARWLPTKN